MSDRTVCSDCPFRVPGANRERLMERMDQGAWIACRHTAAPILGRLSHHDTIVAWASEEECTGARAWRRHRVLPAAIVPAMHPDHLAECDSISPLVIDNPDSWVDLIGPRARSLGFAELGRRAGMPTEQVWQVLNRRGGVPQLPALVKLAHALGLDVTLQPRVTQ